VTGFFTAGDAGRPLLVCIHFVYGPPGTYEPSVVEAAAIASAPIPVAELLEVVGGWPGERRRLRGGVHRIPRRLRPPPGRGGTQHRPPPRRPAIPRRRARLGRGTGRPVAVQPAGVGGENHAAPRVMAAATGSTSRSPATQRARRAPADMTNPLRPAPTSIAIASVLVALRNEHELALRSGAL
jgi:hypothetical protein